MKYKINPFFYDRKSCLFPSYLNILLPELLETVRQMDECLWNQTSGHSVFYYRLASVRTTLRVADAISGTSLPQIPCSRRDWWAEPFSHSSALMSCLGIIPCITWREQHHPGYTRAPQALSSGHPRTVSNSRCHTGNKPCLYSSTSFKWYFPHPCFVAPKDKDRILMRRASSRKLYL